MTEAAGLNDGNIKSPLDIRVIDIDRLLPHQTKLINLLGDYFLSLSISTIKMQSRGKARINYENPSVPWFR